MSMLFNMIGSSMSKFADVAEAAPQAAGASADPQASAQMAPPVTDSQMQGSSPTADPLELLGQAIQNTIKSVNQMVDIYYQLTGNNPTSNDTMQQQGGTTDPNAGSTVQPQQPSGKTASMESLDWGTIMTKGY